MSKARLNRSLRRFLADEDGTTAVEYAIIAAGVGGAIVVVVSTLGGSVSGMWDIVKKAFS